MNQHARLTTTLTIKRLPVQNRLKLLANRWSWQILVQMWNQTLLQFKATNTSDEGWTPCNPHLTGANSLTLMLLRCPQSPWQHKRRRCVISSGTKVIYTRRAEIYRPVHVNGTPLWAVRTEPVRTGVSQVHWVPPSCPSVHARISITTLTLWNCRPHERHGWLGQRDSGKFWCALWLSVRAAAGLRGF